MSEAVAVETVAGDLIDRIRFEADRPIAMIQGSLTPIAANSDGPTIATPAEVLAPAA